MKREFETGTGFSVGRIETTHRSPLLVCKLSCDGGNGLGERKQVNEFKAQQKPDLLCTTITSDDLGVLLGSRPLARLGNCHSIHVSRMMKTRNLPPIYC